MSRTRRQNRVQSSSRIGVAVLGAIALVAVLAVGTLFLRLLDSGREMDAIVREDAMWAVFQADRQVRELAASLRLAADSGPDPYHDALLRSFDLLYSRIRLLERGTFLLDLSSDRQLSIEARALSDEVLALAPLVDALDPDSAEYRAEVAQILAAVAPMVPRSNALILGTNADISTLRVAERELRGTIQDRLAWLALVLILAVLGVFGLLMVQLRHLSRTNQLMALLQERSRRTALRAQAASKAKSAFLATMSHEIRTPLNGVIGSAELLALEPLPESQSRRVGAITASAFLLRDLIDSILDFSRLEAGFIDRTQTETDLAATGDLLHRAFAQRVETAGLALEIALPARMVMVNESRLRQVLVNLIGNALKFTDKGGVRVRGSFPQPDLLRIEVEDDGIGIAPADQGRLFREFSQVDGSHARRYGGTGLGLAICRRVVEGLGGRIGVVSAEGRGSLFWFELPVQPLPGQQTIAGSAHQDAAAALPRAPAERRPGGLDVLVAEDNDLNLDVMRGFLLHLGHRVHAARNGQEAVDVLQALRPDIVLMDMQMPVMDGLEAARRIRRLDRTLPIVGVTANAMDEDRKACLAAGMNDFLPKPVTTGALARLLQRIGPQGLAPANASDATGTPAADARPKPPAQDRTPVAIGAPDPAARRAPGAPGRVDASGGGPAPNAQLRDLIDALGQAPVQALVARFEADVHEVRTSLEASLASPDMAVQDAILHRFKGAALTLGLVASGHLAQRLRTALPIRAEALAELLATVEDDLQSARLALSPADNWRGTEQRRA